MVWSEPFPGNMNRTRIYEMPGRYPGVLLENSDSEAFDSGDSDSPYFRTLEAVRAELSHKRALLDFLPSHHDFHILHAQIIGLQEEFKRLTMDQRDIEMAQLLQDFNARDEAQNGLDGVVNELGAHQHNMPPPQQGSKKRTYSQVDQSPQDNRLEDLRRLAGPSHDTPPPPPPPTFIPPVPFIPMGENGLGAINNGMYLPVTQLAGLDGQTIPQEQQVSSDEGFARALQNQEVIDLTGDDDVYQQFAPRQYARAGPSSRGLLDNPLSGLGGTAGDPSPLWSAGWAFWGGGQDLMVQTGPTPMPSGPQLGLLDNPIVLYDDEEDDDDYGASGLGYYRRHHRSRNADHDVVYNDTRSRGRDEEEDVRKLLEHLSDSAESRQPSDRLQTPPELTIKLMEHQKIGLTWLVKQEESGNKGGILADDMGLGKTIQAISLIVHRKSSNPHNKTTLIVCPVSLMAQWQREIHDKIKPQHALKTYIYHGTQPRRFKNFNVLKEFDVVLTSYGTIAGEFKKKQAWIAQKRVVFPADEFPFLSNESTWYRIILDESQHVKNHRTLASRACTDLVGTYRLCLSGTPMQNNIDDLFGAVRFLHLAMYRDFRSWNTDFGSQIKLGRNYATDAMQRLQALLKAIMLRRKKDSLIDGAPLLTLPPKNIELIHPVFSPDEQEIYHAVEQKVQLRFNKYIANGSVLRNYTYVLLLLLRLRQVCCHPKMITDLSAGISEEEKELQIKLIRKLDPATVERLKRDPVVSCPICFDSPEKMKLISPCGHCLCEECLTNMTNRNMANGDEGNPLNCPICRGPLNPSNLIDWQIFRETHIPEDNGLLQELEGIGNQLDNVLGGNLSDSDSDSDSDTDSETDSDYDDSDLQGFVVPDDEVESDTSGDYSEQTTENRSRFSPVAPARVKREPRPSRQNGIKREEKVEDDLTATQNSTTSSSSAPESEYDNDIWEEFEKSKAKDEGESDKSFPFVDEDAEPTAGKETKDKKTSKKRKGKGKGKKPISKKSKISKKAKGKQKKKEKRVLNLSDKRALAVRNKKARKKYFRELAKDWHSSAKIDKVREILKDIRANDPSEKTIIFSSFTSFLDLLSIPLDREDDFDFERYDGSMTAKDRNDAVINFTENPDVTVMLVSLKAGNSGLNLTVASHVIIIDPWWNPYVEEQAIDRAHRIGQTRPVFVHRLVIENTVEDRILKLQDQKREIISAAMDEEAIKELNRLGVKDLMYLFTGSR
ncbi:hypothetical protein TWF481_001609 [Arthrobotrys musiformis]|uniref:Uncharacterized protein n=1 Tax=Arthrobotrys musiformis TaxID=47236 RepID=A0AAV9VZV4_9PEZI